MKHVRGIIISIATILIHSPTCISAFTLTSRPSKLAIKRPLESSSSLYNYNAGTGINVAEEAPRDIASFEEWASYGGIQKSDGFQLVSSEVDNTGYLDVSAMTTEYVPASSPVAYVPASMILSANAAMREFGGQLPEVEELLQANGYASELRQYYLMLKILVEAEKGSESPWFPYLNSLPRYYSNGASMTVFCYSVVPPLVSRLCKDERARLKNLSLGRRGIPFLSDATRGDDELWKWAYQVVYTRGFEANNGSGDFCVAPMADAFNHATEPNVELSYDGDGSCTARTTREVPAGSPLCLSYGDPTNPSFLLSRYGFLDVTSPATFCKVLPPHVSEEMRNLGYAHDKMLFFKDTGDVSEPVWDVLLYMALGETDPATQQQFYNAHMNADYATKQSVHEQYYPLTAGKLAQHIDTFLYDLEQLQQTGELLIINQRATGNALEHPRLPLIMRHNEFVRNTFMAVRSAQGLG